MISSFLKRYSRFIVHLLLIGILLYGAGRLYFEITAGFTLANISQDLSKEPDHHLPPLSISEQAPIEEILAQPFKYLGKGCQSYVFKSQDGLYVIKFLKYQRFRPAGYLHFFKWIPAVHRYQMKKTVKKREKLDALLNSWKLAYHHLPKETGLIYLHLNRTKIFSKPLLLIDKMGIKHFINPDEVVFLLQRSAKMLCKTIREKMESGKIEEAKLLIKNLLNMLISEYQRGFGDNDHALMQNTGTMEELPIHIDVGQFSEEERFKNRDVYGLELFSKTYKFRIWLSKQYPELEKYVTELLYNAIGPEIYEMKPNLKTVDEGVF